MDFDKYLINEKQDQKQQINKVLLYKSMLKHKIESQQSSVKIDDEEFVKLVNINKKMYQNRSLSVDIITQSKHTCLMPNTKPHLVMPKDSISDKQEYLQHLENLRKAQKIDLRHTL